MTDLWQGIGNWLVSGAWWSLAVDLVLPSVAILVPTVIALRLASRERRAADVDRFERRERERADRVAIGVDNASTAMETLVEAAYEPDFMQAAKIRFRALRALDHIRHNLGPENDTAWKWIVEELKIVAGGLEEKDHLNLPVHMEQIVHRGARFSNVLSDWRMGELDTEWFSKASHVALADTKLLTDDEDDGH